MARPNGNPRKVWPLRLGATGIARIEADAAMATAGNDRDVTASDVGRAAFNHWFTLAPGTRKRLIREAAKAERGPRK